MLAGGGDIPMISTFIAFVVICLVVYTIRNHRAEFAVSSIVIHEIWSGRCRLACLERKGPGPPALILKDQPNGPRALGPVSGTVGQPRSVASKRCVCDTCPCALIDSVFEKCWPGYRAAYEGPGERFDSPYNHICTSVQNAYRRISVTFFPDNRLAAQQRTFIDAHRLYPTTPVLPPRRLHIEPVGPEARVDAVPSTSGRPLQGSLPQPDSKFLEATAHVDRETHPSPPITGTVAPSQPTADPPIANPAIQSQPVAVSPQLPAPRPPPLSPPRVTPPPFSLPPINPSPPFKPRTADVVVPKRMNAEEPKPTTLPRVAETATTSESKQSQQTDRSRVLEVSPPPPRPAVRTHAWEPLVGLDNVIEPLASTIPATPPPIAKPVVRSQPVAVLPIVAPPELPTLIPPPPSPARIIPCPITPPPVSPPVASTLSSKPPTSDLVIPKSSIVEESRKRTLPPAQSATRSETKQEQQLDNKNTPKIVPNSSPQPAVAKRTYAWEPLVGLDNIIGKATDVRPPQAEAIPATPSLLTLTPRPAHDGPSTAGSQQSSERQASLRGAVSSTQCVACKNQGSTCKSGCPHEKCKNK